MAYHFDWTVLLRYRGLLLAGLIATVELAAISLVLSLLIGALVGLARSFCRPRVGWVFALYTECFRNIPPIVQFFFWSFAVGLNVFPAAVAGLTVFTSAYIAEIMRSGVKATEQTQFEAARCAGMSSPQMIAHIVLPQALMRSLPALSVEFINIIKNSSVAMTIGYTELTFQTQQIEAETFRGFEAATAATILYVLLAAVVLFGMHAAERMWRLDH